MKISLQRALVVLLGGTVLVALIPGGLLLDRRLTAELERSAREGLAIAPRLLADRNSARADALMMHAKDMAAAPPVVQAFLSGDPEAAVNAAVQARIDDSEQVIVISGGEEEAWAGPMPDSGMVAATREGRMPVSFQTTSDGPAHVALAPVMDGDAWLGAAGVLQQLDEEGVAALAGLTASEVVVEPVAREPWITTVDTSLARDLVAAAAPHGVEEGVVEATLPGGSRWWITVAELGGAGRILFARSVQRELAVLPRLRRGAAFAGGLAFVLAILLGILAARTIARPVSQLATASGRLAGGDFAAPLPSSTIREVELVSDSFAQMRAALEERLEELEEANQALETQQERLQALQGELIQQDRLAAGGRLVAELSHEIRNPVASIRNCLEVVDRRLAEDEEGRVFTRLAIEELARMHELAEGLLDLNRPVDPDAVQSDPAVVVTQVAALMGAGAQGDRWPIELDFSPENPEVAIAPDALKQVLINLVQNAQEAMPDGGPIEIRGEASGSRMTLEVRDGGPGIPDDIAGQIFDPFFTTKGEVRGVGLGLFVAQGIVRRYGGALSARNRADAPGASFEIELAVADATAERGTVS